MSRSLVVSEEKQRESGLETRHVEIRHATIEDALALAHMRYEFRPDRPLFFRVFPGTQGLNGDSVDTIPLEHSPRRSD
jgi:hypothetical protein